MYSKSLDILKGLIAVDSIGQSSDRNLTSIFRHWFYQQQEEKSSVSSSSTTTNRYYQAGKSLTREETAGATLRRAEGKQILAYIPHTHTTHTHTHTPHTHTHHTHTHHTHTHRTHQNTNPHQKQRPVKEKTWLSRRGTAAPPMPDVSSQGHQQPGHHRFCLGGTRVTRGLAGSRQEDSRPRPLGAAAAAWGLRPAQRLERPQQLRPARRAPGDEAQAPWKNFPLSELEAVPLLNKSLRPSASQAPRRKPLCKEIEESFCGTKTADKPRLGPQQRSTAKISGLFRAPLRVLDLDAKAAEH